MRVTFLFITLCFLLKTIKAQNAIEIPEFKNINPNDKYPERSILSSYTNNFDILISLKSYSAWGPDQSIKILAHHKSGWYKIEISTDPLFINNSVCYSTYRINDSIGNMIWDTLLKNHLFEMKDGRIISFICAEKKDTILTKEGKILEVVEPFDLDTDGPEYEFEIITKYTYKKLYFYDPQEFLRRCPTFSESKWFVTSIAIFEKYLGT
jgi:hypothetical protein